MIKKSEGPAQ